MRRATAIETVLAMMLAFLLAPFQHVHTDSFHPGHAHAGELHAHFFGFHSHEEHRHALPADTLGIDDDDDDHANARAIDTFSPVVPASIHLFAPSRAPNADVLPPPHFIRIESIEARANSPPEFDRFSARAPPSNFPS